MYEQSEKYIVNFVSGKGYEVMGQWKDDIHDIRTRLVFDYETYRILEAEASGVTTPFGEVCNVGLENINKMVGLQVGPGFKGQVKKLLMGKSGCIHLGEMVINSFTAGLQASSRYIPDWVDEDDYNQRWGMWSAFFKDTCIYFAQPDAMEDLQEIVRKDKNDEKQAASAS